VGRRSVALARQERRSFARERDGGLELYTPVVTGATVSVVRARVPAELLDAGVRTAWLALAGVAVVLVAVAAVIADRLARSVTRDATELSAPARALAAGRADARATPGRTPDLADAARALNVLADRIDELRAAERERVADLSACGPRSRPCGSTPRPRGRLAGGRRGAAGGGGV
jgi:methyl-accepting chemotaxis protein